MAGKAPADYDFYFRNQEDMTVLLSRFLPKTCSFFEVLPGVYEMDPGDEDLSRRPAKKDTSYRIHVTKQSVTFTEKLTGKKYQLVTRFCAEPDALFETYDFYHCMAYYHAAYKAMGVDPEDTLVFHPKALPSMASKTLQYSSSRFPIKALLRAHKFIRRGWTCPGEELLKISCDIHDLNLKEKSVFLYQLRGFYGEEFRALETRIGSIPDEDFNKKAAIQAIEELLNY